jgi:hypothetical protein
MKALLLAGLALLILLTACGGTGQGDSQPADSPEELGELIGEAFVKMMAEAKTLAAPLPPAQELNPKIAALKETNIQTFVRYGRQRDTMSEEDKVKVSNSALVYLNEHIDRDTQWINEVIARYEAEDMGLVTNVRSLQVLTQYAFFEVLLRNDPAEAQRLGIQ